MVSRRRSTPWIQRWSRPIIGAIATLGALNTGYLTYEKFAGGTAGCPSGGCDTVLASAYATVLGQPLALFGLLAYIAMGTMAIGPLLINPDTQKDLRRKLEDLTWLGLFMGSAAMAVFSGYLMYILATQLKAFCPYCIASALFAGSLFLLSLLGRAWEDGGQLFFIGIIVAVVTLTGTLGIYSGINKAPQSAGNSGPPIVATSGSAEIALAEYLTQSGAKFYGAYWCPHCHDQKELFGSQAVTKLPYIECAPEGKSSQTDVCRAQGENLKYFPTWEIKGKFYSGTKSLEELSKLSGYDGPRNFQNTLPGP
ncbi:hypothetical protein BST81_00535 [Leptolyngbya sp. 'hensonii']|uniref:vitamin K epoxide reductase family protein n=1 Tax=Leptolyngbya sp. 'hensonii' TaxID=1922337 RepID=UPI00094F97B4|nr:vitamin K epoxide reductase family protein [Leptolyngbya sp. 'hensonii']OLP20265.1 hypothetical protein BST81_00535 [Leptolyngbya sp. 'hensonii']